MLCVDLPFDFVAFDGMGASLSILGLRCAWGWARLAVISALSRYGVLEKTHCIARRAQFVQGGPPVHCYWSVSNVKLLLHLLANGFYRRSHRLCGQRARSLGHGGEDLRTSYVAVK